MSSSRKKQKHEEAQALKKRLIIGDVVNLPFLVFFLMSAIVYRSGWFIALSLYYAVLVGLKFYVAFTLDKKGKDAMNAFRNIGLVMVMMNLALVTMISTLIASPEIALHEYSTLVSIVMAVWTLAMFIMSVVSFAHQWGERNSVVFAGKMIQLIGATVSVLMLQTAMIASFGAAEIDRAHSVVSRITSTLKLPSPIEKAALDLMDTFALSNSITGAVVGLMVVVATFYLIIKGTRIGEQIGNSSRASRAKVRAKK